VDGKPATAAVAAVEDFEAVFREHFAPVYGFIAGRVGRALAEDLAAEVFATAYRRRAAYQPERGITAVLAIRDRRQRGTRALAGRAAAT
jgi:DNA-directed RNA polymerase specialized sigma24 family protein